MTTTTGLAYTCVCVYTYIYVIHVPVLRSSSPRCLIFALVPNRRRAFRASGPAGEWAAEGKKGSSWPPPHMRAFTTPRHDNGTARARACVICVYIVRACVVPFTTPFHDAGRQHPIHGTKTARRARAHSQMPGGGGVHKETFITPKNGGTGSTGCFHTGAKRINTARIPAARGRAHDRRRSRSRVHTAAVSASFYTPFTTPPRGFVPRRDTHARFYYLRYGRPLPAPRSIRTYPLFHAYVSFTRVRVYTYRRRPVVRAVIEHCVPDREVHTHAVVLTEEEGHGVHFFPITPC